MSIDRRTATINGEKIAYTYNLKTREVLVPAKGIQFIATCYDWAKAEIADALAAAAAPAVESTPEVIAEAAATTAQQPNLFNTGTLHHELVYLADGTPAPKCRNRATKGQAVYRERATVSCNSCSGAHRIGTHLG